MNEAWTNAYIGIPFRVHGRERATGLDCWGLVRVVYRDLYGIELPAFLSYDEHHRLAELSPYIQANRAEDWTEIPAGHERPGDVIVVKLAGQPMHVGIVAAGGLMLHACDRSGSCLESYRDRKWRQRVDGFYRHKGVADAAAA